jgi:hypothetical protein
VRGYAIALYAKRKGYLRAPAVPKPAQWSTDSYTMTYYDSVIVMALAATAVKSTSPAIWNASLGSRPRQISASCSLEP